MEGAAVVGLLSIAPALAADEFEPRSPVSLVLFGSLEAGPTKSFASIGLKRSLGGGGLDASGFRTLVKIGVAQEQANRSPPRGTAYKVEAQALIGYEWRIGDSFVSVYAGTDYESEQRPCGCGVAITHHYGQRLQADLWSTPFPDTMLQASAYAATPDRRFWGRVAAGWALRDVMPMEMLRHSYLGPEVEAYRQIGYHKLRLGLHLTGLQLFGLNWRLSGGLQQTSDRPSEAYATLGLHWRR